MSELDAGPIAAQESFAIGPEDDAGAVFARAATVAVRLLDDVLDDPAPVFVPAVRATASRMPRRSRPPTGCSTSTARPRRSCVVSVRSLRTWARAATLHGRPVTVWRARVGEDGEFEPVDVQPDGGRRMEYAAWLRGLR